MKKVITILLVFVLLGNCFVTAQETKTEITYENSLYVKALSTQEIFFTPDDLLNVDCSKVLMLHKYKWLDAEQAPEYEYKFLVVLNQSGKEARAKAEEQLQQLPFVDEVTENIFAEFQLTVDRSPIILKKGEQTTFEYSGGGIADIFNNQFKVTFEVDPNVYDESAFADETFSHLGITDYWASDSADSVWESKGSFVPSVYHKYCTKMDFGNQGNGFEMLDALVRTEGILNVYSMVTETTGTPYGLNVENRNPEVFELDNDYDAMIATVIGQKTGEGTIAFLSGSDVKVTRSVMVYQLGDLNGDEKVDAKDALEVLKASVKKVEFTPLQMLAAEVDGIEGIGARDALEILKYTVKKIDKFPIQQGVETPTDVTPTDGE